MKKKTLNKINDIGKRALKTFFQAFVGALAIVLPTTDFNQQGVLKAVLIGALASGLSATMNYINNLLSEENE